MVTWEPEPGAVVTGLTSCFLNESKTGEESDRSIAVVGTSVTRADRIGLFICAVKSRPIAWELAHFCLSGLGGESATRLLRGFFGDPLVWILSKSLIMVFETIYCRTSGLIFSKSRFTSFSKFLALKTSYMSFVVIFSILVFIFFTLPLRRKTLSCISAIDRW